MLNSTKRRRGVASDPQDAEVAVQAEEAEVGAEVAPDTEAASLQRGRQQSGGRLLRSGLVLPASTAPTATVQRGHSQGDMPIPALVSRSASIITAAAPSFHPYLPVHPPIDTQTLRDRIIHSVAGAANEEEQIESLLARSLLETVAQLEGESVLQVRAELLKKAREVKEKRESEARAAAPAAAAPVIQPATASPVTISPLPPPASAPSHPPPTAPKPLKEIPPSQRRQNAPPLTPTSADSPDSAASSSSRARVRLVSANSDDDDDDDEEVEDNDDGMDDMPVQRPSRKPAQQHPSSTRQQHRNNIRLPPHKPPPAPPQSVVYAYDQSAAVRYVDTSMLTPAYGATPTQHYSRGPMYMPTQTQNLMQMQPVHMQSSLQMQPFTVMSAVPGMGQGMPLNASWQSVLSVVYGYGQAMPMYHS